MGAHCNFYPYLLLLSLPAPTIPTCSYYPYLLLLSLPAPTSAQDGLDTLQLTLVVFFLSSTTGNNSCRKQVKPSMDSAPPSCFPQSNPQVLATLNNVNHHTSIIVQLLWSYTCATHSLGYVTDIVHSLQYYILIYIIIYHNIYSYLYHNILSSRHSCIIKLS